MALLLCLLKAFNFNDPDYIPWPGYGPVPSF